MQKFRLFEYSNNGASIDIDEQEFQRLKTWHKNVVALTEVELLFSAVARTAFEFERFLLTSALEKVFERESFDTLSGAKFHFNELTSAANIHLLTFLSAVRAYHDQRSSILSSSCFPREVVVEISKVFSAAFDESFDYRLMEALRNYAQHNRLPISAVTWETNFETPPNAKNSSPNRSRISISPFLSKSKLLFHREKLKKNTMDELGRLGFERLEVKPIFRNYLSLLARCHNNLRGKAAPFVADAESGLKKTREGFIASNSTPVGCQGKNLKVSCETDGILEEYYVDSVLVETLKMHLSSWKGLADHWRKYASSRVTVQNDAYQGDKAQDIWIN